MVRKLLALALCALWVCVCLSAGLSAAAADLDYTGVVDPESGEPAAEGSGGSDRSALSGSMYYDWLTHDYVYPISDSLGQVHSSAADGMVLTVPVSVKAENGASVVVYADGVEYTGDLTRISAPGKYQVSAQVEGQNRRLFTFSLVGSSTNAIHTFLAPDGFYITGALKDGENIYLDRFTVSMEEEGDYEITYEYPGRRGPAGPDPQPAGLFRPGDGRFHLSDPLRRAGDAGFERGRHRHHLRYGHLPDAGDRSRREHGGIQLHHPAIP